MADVASSRRHIVLCCDGTNNTLTGGFADTNVLKLYEHLVKYPDTRQGIERIVFYDPGVGTPDALPPADVFDWIGRSWSRARGLAAGRGVFDNIAAGYRFAIRHWQGPDDRIYIFGFSRGAFTARCIAGMINLFGIIEADQEEMLPTLVRIYFSLPDKEKDGGARHGLLRRLHYHFGRRYKAAADPGGRQREPHSVGRSALAEQVRRQFASEAGRRAEVHWVGVWDTVESVGMPGPWSQRNPSDARLAGKRIRNARHALALDEHRRPFLPRLYDEPGDIGPTVDVEGRPVPGQTLRQRWFQGVHCDVGGSYRDAESGLSDDAMRWMVGEVADDLGVPLWSPAEGTPAARLRHDPLWDTPWWALAGMTMRDMRPRASATTERPEQPMAVIAAPSATIPSNSVWQARRPAWPALAAVVLGLATWILSGLCLLDPALRAWSVETLMDALAAPLWFAFVQVAWIGFGHLGTSELAPWNLEGQPAWAMVWDLLFIPCYGYLVARIASRAFAWLVGARVPGAARPWWCSIGLAPMVAVVGDAAEDALTLAALAVHGLGTDLVADGLLRLVSLASLAKMIGLAGCAALLAVRIVMIAADRTPKGLPSRVSEA